MTGELEQFKEQVTRLAAEAFPSDVPGPQLADSLIARLCEETGEVAREVRRYWQKRWGHVARLAAMCNVSLDEAKEATLVKFQRRLEQSGPSQTTGS